MSNPTYPTFNFPALAVRKEMLDAPVTIQTSLSLKEVRIGYGSAVRWKYTVPVSALNSTDRSNWVTFVNNALGPMYTFSITDPDTGGSVTVRLEDPGSIARMTGDSSYWGNLQITMIGVL